MNFQIRPYLHQSTRRGGCCCNAGMTSQNMGSFILSKICKYLRTYLVRPRATCRICSVLASERGLIGSLPSLWGLSRRSQETPGERRELREGHSLDCVVVVSGSAQERDRDRGKGLPYMTSAEFWDLLTPFPPLSTKSTVGPQMCCIN